MSFSLGAFPSLGSCRSEARPLLFFADNPFLTRVFWAGPLTLPWPIPFLLRIRSAPWCPGAGLLSYPMRSRQNKALRAYDSQLVALREATASIASMTAPIPFTSLERTARTPAADASSDSCGVANIVYINIEQSGARPLITRAASSPFITGIA
jgi:hypothetical protein